MKKILLVSAALALAQAAFSQGTVNFDNRANTGGTPGTFPGAVIAPVYNMDSANPTSQKTGNTSTGLPAGNAVYGGPLLSGSGFMAALYGGLSTAVTGNADQNNLQFLAVTTMRTNSTGINAGRVAASAALIPVPGVHESSADRATFQLRVWDSKGGTITSWDQLYDAATGVANPQNAGVARGYSTLFTVPFALGLGSTPSPNLDGLTSFQLFIVPEPSVIALGVLGAGCLFLLRRRK